LAEKQFFNDNVNLNDNLNFLGLSIIEVEQKERFFCEAGFFFFPLMDFSFLLRKFSIQGPETPVQGLWIVVQGP